jgi:titin
MLDTTFDGDGRVITDVLGSVDTAREVAFQSDGKMVVAGDSERPGGGIEFAIVRYNADGTIDSGFGVQGIVTLEFGKTFNRPTGVAVDSQDRIIVAGSAYDNLQAQVGTNADFAVARLTTAGALDSGFGIDGKRTVDFGGTVDVAGGVAIDSRDRIIVAGHTSGSGGTGPNFAVALLTTDGALDGSFDGDGRQTVDFGGSVDLGQDVAVDSQDRIIIAGLSSDDFAVARLSIDGALDGSFDADGKRTVDFGSTSEIGKGVTVDSLDRIIVAGRSNDDFAVARLTTDGALDSSFDDDGKQLVDFGNTSGSSQAVTVDAQDRIIVVGGSVQSETGGDFAVARLTTDGALDGSFDGDGKKLIDFGNTDDVGWGVTVDALDRIIVVGESFQSGSIWDFALARLIGNPSAVITPTLGLIQDIEGIGFEENAVNDGFFHIPPDPIGAVGLEHVVSAVNTSIEWHTKAGGQQSSQALRDFFAPLSPVNSTFDPKVIYDQHADRFVVVTLEQQDQAMGDAATTSRILLAVSDDGDPNGVWHFHEIDAKVTIGGVPHWADYPGFAVDDQAVYLTANMFTFGSTGSFGGARLWIVEKGTGTGGFYARGLARVTLHDPFAAVGMNVASTLQPAQIFGSVPGTTGTFLVSAGWVDGSGNDFLHLIRVNNPLGTVSFTGQFLNAGNIHAGSLPDAPQPGTATLIETNDERALNAAWRNDVLWVTNTVNPPSGPDAGQATAHWYQISTANLSSLFLTRQGNAGGNDVDPGAHTFFPSIAVDTDGNMALAFALSSPNDFAGAYYAALPAGGSLSQTRVIAEGEGPYVRTFGGSRNRWGDYSGLALDPADESTFWAFNEYALAPGSLLNGEDGRWGTRWGSFSLSIPVLDVLPGAGTIRLFADAGDLVVQVVEPSPVEVFRQALTSLSGIAINGAEDSETFELTIDGITANDLPGGIWFRGGEGSGDDDTLNISGAATVTNSEYTTAGPESGTIVMDGLTVFFSEFEPISDDLTVTNRTFSIGISENQTIRLADDGVAGNGRTVIDSGGTLGFEGISFTQPTTSLTIKGGVGNDQVTLESVDSLFTTALIDVRAGDGDDRISVQALNADYSGTIIVDGGTGTNDATVSVSLAGMTMVLSATTTDLVVSNTQNDGSGSLRNAIAYANAHPGLDVIEFNIPLSDPGYDPLTGGFAIRLSESLPAITEAVVIDATLQPSYAGTPLIELDGSLTVGVNALHITGGNSTIRGLVINGFDGSGIIFEGGSGNVIEGNFIGTDLTGTAARPNGTHGVIITGGSSDNRIGTDGDGVNDESERNLISANRFDGVVIAGAGTNGNVVAGNLIGTDVTGTNALGNGNNDTFPTAGVLIIDGAQRNRVGTDGNGLGDHVERNVISGNVQIGVFLGFGTATQDNVVAGNYIGTDATGTRGLGNGTGIIIFDGAASSRIGTNGDGIADEAERNIISGNGRGMTLTDGASLNVIAGNFIGTDVSGTAPIGNTEHGVVISGASNYVGTDGNGIADRAEMNLISGNGGSGLVLVGVNAVGNRVAGNFVGTDRLGNTSLSNAGHGMLVTAGASFNQIGTDGNGAADDAERNVISGNGLDGVLIEESSNDNVVSGNHIGTNADGSAALGNGRWGVGVAVGQRNRIGTDGSNDAFNASERNVISGNSQQGVVLGGAGTEWNIVAGNYIGTDVTGTFAVANGTDPASWPSAGIMIHSDASRNRIGTNGDDAADVLERNVISGNAGVGIFVGYGTATQVNVIAGNYIGTNVTGTVALPNHASGILVFEGAMRTQIGTDGIGNLNGNEAERNLISGNGGSGIQLNTGRNGVAGNFIGTDASGNGPLGNAGQGVLVSSGGMLNIIGGLAGGPNTIAFNSQEGVLVSGESSRGNSIRENSIHSNGSLAIALDPAIPRFTPRIQAVASGANTRIVGRIEGPGAAEVQLDFYANTVADPSGYGEGERYLDSFLIVTDASGTAAFDVTLNAAALPGEMVTATGTTWTTIETTSEFSGAFFATGIGSILTGGGPDDDEIVLVPGSTPGTINVSVNGIDLGDLPADDITAYGFGGSDSIQVHEEITVSATLNGGDGDDTVQAGGGTTVLVGGDGNDTLVGGTGTNTLDGGDGDDVLQDGGGTNTVIGGTGSNTFVVGGGTNTFEVAVGSSTDNADLPQVIVTPVAAGNEGAAIPLAIWAGLSDTDGSESLSIDITGVPDSATLSNGQKNADGSWTITTANPSIDLNGMTITPQDNGQLSLAVTATATETANGTSNAIAATIAVTVNNVAPHNVVSDAAIGEYVFAVGATRTFAGTFADVGTLDTHTAVWTFRHVLGTTLVMETRAGTVTQGAGSGTVSDTFVFDNDDTNQDGPGVYTVTLTITDDDGGATTSESQTFVVYDPSEGFVTGGGWIDSPEGAYVPDTTLTGKANFGFVSKYKKGQTTPSGNTTFEFKVADLKFKSTSYEWLVVAGARAHYKGEGTINDAGNYGFLLTVIDGQVNGGGGTDKFRMKIWDKDNADAIVYDNGLGADDDSEPPTAIGGGSIIIHDNGQALHAAADTTGAGNFAALSHDLLNPAVDQAISYWAAAGADASQIDLLRGVDVQLADLSGSLLGMASAVNMVWIDVDAAGIGWSITDEGAFAGFDLVSVVSHELGHMLGLDDASDLSIVMGEFLSPGIRRLPGSEFSEEPPNNRDEEMPTIQILPIALQDTGASRRHASANADAVLNVATGSLIPWLGTISEFDDDEFPATLSLDDSTPVLLRDSDPGDTDGIFADLDDPVWDELLAV